MSSYAVIIVSGPTFKPFMPALSKLVTISSAVHQITFTLMSSMPFAIDQGQDPGLIFLSAMATSICDTLNDNNSDVSQRPTSPPSSSPSTSPRPRCWASTSS
ncbi:hypothetical protein PHMEG_00027396 [Phytophthora megakarya]|uniref:Uncharacterized protein n=1 Tax=Phytophthora megakarya TaxID=4795 RepID=A0A225V8N9_9STRA|nr:hypothetical protein PHMEG_00027396 [Phytophthora megakarya]